MGNFMTKHSLTRDAINFEPLNTTHGTKTTPILRKKLPKGINAEANNDGTITVDPSLKGKELRTAINHEKVHMDQMDRGDLNYNDKHVIWKGKKYLRSKMREGEPKLPWEREAYNKQNKKQ
jgi:hypothetical protein